MGGRIKISYKSTVLVNSTWIYFRLLLLLTKTVCRILDVYLKFELPLNFRKIEVVKITLGLDSWSF